MSLFRKILGGISYVCLAGGPVLASTGVGLPIGVGIGAVGIAAGAVLHFMDSPRTPADVLATAKVLVAQAAAVKQAAGK